MPSLWDMFTFKPGNPKKKVGTKIFNGKLSPKNEKICPGCPSKLVEPIKSNLILPDPSDPKNDTKVVNIVNLKDFKKKPKGPGSLF